MRPQPRSCGRTKKVLRDGFPAAGDERRVFRDGESPGSAAARARMPVPMTADMHQLLARYERVRRKFEIGAWVVGFLFSTIAEGIVWWIDTGRFRGHFEGWEPFTWEATSHVMWLALIPLMLAFERRVPLGLFVPRRNFL